MRNQATKQTIFQYIAFGPTADEANNLLPNYGMPKAKNRTDLANTLAAIFQVNQEIMMDLAAIHPDRDIIEEFIEKNKKPEPAPAPTHNFSNCSGCSGAHMNCAGCGGKCGGNGGAMRSMFSADGNDSASRNPSQVMAQNNLMTVGVVLALFGVIVIALKK